MYKFLGKEFLAQKCISEKISKSISRWKNLCFKIIWIKNVCKESFWLNNFLGELYLGKKYV
jgi:hypothetical protein